VKKLDRLMAAEAAAQGIIVTPTQVAQMRRQEFQRFRQQLWSQGEKAPVTDEGMMFKITLDHALALTGGSK
jgi:mitochondrial fission protein ELM1